MSAARASASFASRAFSAAAAASGDDTALVGAATVTSTFLGAPAGATNGAGGAEGARGEGGSGGGGGETFGLAHTDSRASSSPRVRTARLACDMSRRRALAGPPLVNELSLWSSSELVSTNGGGRPQPYAVRHEDLRAIADGDFDQLAAVLANPTVFPKLQPQLISMMLGQVMLSAPQADRLKAVCAARLRGDAAAYGALVPIALGSGRSHATTARIVNLGTDLGVPQGQLAAERTALNAVIKVIAPTLYAALFAFGAQRGVIALPFYVTASLLAASVVLASTIQYESSESTDN